MFDGLKKYLNFNTVWVKCGGFACNNVFQVRDSNEKPCIFICNSCEEKFNQGIVEYVHANTGKTKGNFHLTDGYSKGD